MDYCFRFKSREAYLTSSFFDVLKQKSLFNCYIPSKHYYNGIIDIKLKYRMKEKRVEISTRLYSDQYEKIPKYIYYISEKPVKIDGEEKISLHPGFILDSNGVYAYLQYSSMRIFSCSGVTKTGLHVNFIENKKFVKRKKNPLYKSDFRIWVERLLHIKPKEVIPIIYPGLREKIIPLHIAKDEYYVDPN